LVVGGSDDAADPVPGAGGAGNSIMSRNGRSVTVSIGTGVGN